MPLALFFVEPMASKSFQPTIVPELRSPYDEVNGLVYFARMLSKIRLHAAGKLPQEYHKHLGDGFDGRCIRFLGVDYEALRAETLKGEKSDAALLDWCFQNGRHPNDEEIEVWSGFLMKRGWRDTGREALERRLKEAGLPEDGALQTMFDFIDADEGRSPRF